MSTVQRPGERYVDFDEYIEFQLDKARTGIKWTDILAAAAGVAALVVGYLVAFVAADQWVFEGGVPRTLRLTLLCLVAAVSLGWLGWKVVRPYLRRVNDLYAARMLEESEPNLRGSLFGLVDARRGGRPPAEEVRRALEKRAATTLAEIDPDAAVDRRPLMRTAYVLLGVVLIACAYAVLSPKRIGPSILRALVPSSAVGVATRTEILDVKPGNVSVLAGTTLDVAVMLRGETPEQVMLFFSTSDRRFADEPVELRLHDETTREYRGALVGDAGRGLSQDLTYRIEAGDDAAGPYVVEVGQPPAATITQVKLEFPPYTGLGTTTTRDDPPIDAIEGTNVTLVAKANRPIKAAKLAFADDERFVTRAEEVPMRIADDGVTLTASWKLAVRSDDTSPAFYRIECRDVEGESNPNPAVYPLAIRQDKAPEVVLHDPKSDIERPANAVVPLFATAHDPDFLLREVTLRLEKNGQELPERNVLWEGAEREAAARHDWNLAELGLKPGDVVTYYVQARDNREPEFNRRNTPKLNVTITAPVSKDQVEQQLAEDRRKQDQELAAAEANETAADRPDQQPGGEVEEPSDGEPNDPNAEREQDQDQLAEAGAPQQGGNKGADGNESGESEQQSGSRAVPNDGTADDEAIRRLLDRQREQKEPHQSEPEKATDPAQQGEASESKPGQGGENGKGRPQEQRRNGGEPESQQSGEASDGQSQDQPSGQGNSRGQGSRGKKPNAGEQRGNPAGETSSEAGSDESEAGESGEAAGNQGQKSPPTGGKSGRPEQADSKDADGSESPTGESEASDEPSGAESSKPNGALAKGARPETGDPTGDETPADAAAEGGRGEKETRPPRKGDAPQGGKTADGPAPPNAANGERTGPQPRPSDTDPNAEPAGTDDERSPSDPGRPNPDAGPPGATERNPGEGRPDQRSEGPDAGEKGTGQPNADGTPDGEAGPGDAGTKPGDQQTADQPTGRQGPGRDGRPDRAGGPQNGGQPMDGQQGEQPAPGAQGEQQGAQGQKSGPEGEQQGAKQGKRPGQSQPRAGRQQPGQGQSGQQEQQQGQPGQSQQEGQGAEGHQEGQGAGEGQSGQKPSGQGQQGQGQKGEGQQGEGQQGQGGQDQEGEGQEGQSKQGEGQKGQGQQGKSDEAGEKGQQGQSGKGEQGQSGEGQSGQSGEGGKQPGQGGQGGQPGGESGQPGSEGGQGGQTGKGGGQTPGGGGATGNNSGVGGGAGGESGEAPESEAANADYSKQATDLALRQLEDDLKRGEVDEQLLKELGWTKEDAERFAERLRKNLSAPTGEETPQDVARRKEFENMLESLSVENAPQAREARTGRVKNVDGVGTKNPGVPSEYRDAWESFTRSVAGRRGAAPAGK